MRYILTTCYLLLFVLSTYAQAPAQRIDSVMQIAHQRGIFNGNILVAVKGKIIYQKSFGYADGSKKTPLSLPLKFDIGSVSKEFNGTGIMLLKEQGKLSLDDPLSKYFPEFPEWAQRVKVRHLINYTSGIPVFAPTANDNDSIIYSDLKKFQKLSFEPGTGYIYNHYNVYLQMRLIEKLSELKYTDFLKKYIFKPAGMTETVVDYPVDAPGMARAFDNEGRNTPYAQGISGWVRLPVTDLYKFTQALHSYRFISKQSFAELAANFSGGESSLGTTGFENGELIWHQHQGSNSNYEATLYSQVPEHVTIVMMTNNQQMKVLPLKSAIMNVFHHEPVTVPKKSVYLEIRDKVLANTDSGLKYYQDLKANYQEKYDFSFEIGDLISTGKYVQRRNHFDDAIKVFSLAVALPAKAADVSYGYELMAECYMKKGDKAQALLNYNKALTVDPKNKNAEGMIAELSK